MTKIYIVWHRHYLTSDDAWDIENIFRTQKSAEDYCDFIKHRDRDHHFYRVEEKEVTDE